MLDALSAWRLSLEPSTTPQVDRYAGAGSPARPRSGSEEEAAATKIQAVARGRSARATQSAMPPATLEALFPFACEPDPLNI